MSVNDALRLLAGFMVLLSLTLYYFFSPWWLLLAVFVALNQIQSAFSKSCPAMWFFRRLGLRQ
jgi:hypothetical protein